ncbi:MAG: hypothetical protein ACI8RZ_003349 [Myxococcota bacterium]|jgi:hypothetical protein
MSPLLLSLAASAWPLHGSDNVVLEREIVVETLLSDSTIDTTDRIVTDPTALAAVAASALSYLENPPEADPGGVHAGMFAELGVSLDDVRATLAFVVRIAEEDATTGANRLGDPMFLADNFRLIQWKPDREGASARGHSLPSDGIRMTRYLVYQFPGSPVQTATYTHPLYAPPTDACRTRYTRMEVIGGIYHDNPDGCTAEPLVWLTRRGVFEAMMQGTIEVTLPDSSTALFNVSRPNEMPYDPTIRDPTKQKRYWYFAEVDGVMGWGPAPPDKVRLQPNVSVAGDVYNLGLGKLLALRSGGELRLVVLSDTGGAFQPNLFQLDFFVGGYSSRAAFIEGTKGLPSVVEAGVLVWRPKVKVVDGQVPVP